MKKHFTLNELLVIVGTVALFAAMLLPALATSVRGDAKTTLCMENIRQLTQGEQMYAADNNDYRTPVVNNEPERCGYLKSPRQLALLYKNGYVTEAGTFYCPNVEMPVNPAQLRDPALWSSVKNKDVIVSYWSANWYEKTVAWEYRTFKLTGPFPTFTGWRASGKTPGDPSEMPLVMDIGGVWKTLNPAGLPHVDRINVSFADGSAVTYVDGNEKIRRGDWHNIWLAPDAIMLSRCK
ncbi:MAG: type II secretion system protein [Lentisphaerae bacterium]|nr:type II secretion system protein [Lentisphaerota bacterium]